MSGRAFAIALMGMLGVLGASACGACGKSSPGSGPNATPGGSATSVLAALGDAAARDPSVPSLWANARGGDVEDLAALATHEGAAGLVAVATDEEALRPTALRAMAFAHGWAQLPYLAKIAAGDDDEAARVALESAIELAARPRRAEDPEDAEELEEGCKKLGALAKDVGRARDRRVRAVRALRMMPCPKQELPTDVDAR